jgi:HrpA-like RNA helicase
LHPIQKKHFFPGSARELNRSTTTGRLNNGIPQVPPPRGDSDLATFRQSLPVYLMKDAIIRALNDNKVLLVAGETGSGKTTQVRRDEH